MLELDTTSCTPQHSIAHPFWDIAHDPPAKRPHARSMQQHEQAKLDLLQSAKAVAKVVACLRLPSQAPQRR